MRRINYFDGIFCHVFNRGVDKRPIFQDKNDFLRFMKSVLAFNVVDRRSNNSLSNSVNEVLTESIIDQKPYVRIISYCLITNHFHLLLQQVSEHGISEFMRRLGTGYTQYFNKKYNRSGRLFEGPYQSLEIKNEQQLVYTTKYIHSNPSPFIKFGDSKKESWASLNNKLSTYQWSSYGEYLGTKEARYIDRTWISKNLVDLSGYEEIMKLGFYHNPVVVKSGGV